jgi:hypothetical protein
MQEEADRNKRLEHHFSHQGSMFHPVAAVEFSMHFYNSFQIIPPQIH